MSLRRLARRLRDPGNGYIPARATVAAARAKGLSIEAYVEELWDQRGETAAIIERLRSVGALEPTDTVVEIGPGTGRYLAHVQRIVRPRRHVIYETAEDWRSWLVAEYGVEAAPTDGETLAGVEAAGLIHAHGVFVYTPFLVMARYLDEIVRAATGWVVFDFYSPAEFDDATLRRWWAAPDRYPVVCDRSWVLSRLPGFELVDEWTARHGQGRSRYVALRRRP